MSLEESDSLDYLGLEKGSGQIALTLVDDQDWSDEARHLELLQSKINRYLDFAESEDLLNEIERQIRRPPNRELPVKIKILAKFPLTEVGAQFLEHVRGVAAENEIELTHQVLGGG